MSMSMVYTKFESELVEYMKGKLPDLPAHIAQEIGAHISNKTMILVNDMIREYVRESKMYAQKTRRSRDSQEGEGNEQRPDKP